MSADTKIEMYHITQTYLEGWYTLEDLKRVMETMERIREVNKRLAEEAGDSTE